MDDLNNKQVQKRILIVEDDVSLAEIYSTMLQAEGYLVKHVANGKDAVPTALEFHPDLMLLDIMMPDLNGFDVLQMLRSKPETANLQVAILSALDGDVFTEKARQLKVYEYFTKSKVKTTDVIERINQLLL